MAGGAAEQEANPEISAAMSAAALLGTTSVAARAALIPADAALICERHATLYGWHHALNLTIYAI